MVTKLDKVEVVTIGVGWAGGIVAAEMTKAGYKVVGLEKGKDRTTEDFAQKHDELKYQHRQDLMQSLHNQTMTIRNTIDEDARPLRDNAMSIIGEDVGGGGLHWGAQTHRYFPYDFEIRSQTIERYGEDKIPKEMSIQDWGITYDELEPYYDKFEKTMGTSGEENELEPPRANPYPTPPLKKTKSMTAFQQAAENLGYHPYVIPAGTLSEQYTNPDGQTINACQYNAFCGNHGCEWGARASPITTVIPTAHATGNFELRTNSIVTRILHKDDKAIGVLYTNTASGEVFEQPADIVVLTSYIFNNTRLLLLSEIGKPYDSETGEGVIGKNYTDHHSFFGATGFFDNEKYIRYIGTGALGMAYGDFNADNFDHSDVDFIHGGQVEIRESGNGPIGNNNVPEGTPAWGKEFKQQSLHYYNRSLYVWAQEATLPSKNNYLDLDPTYVDSNGEPLLRMTYERMDNEIKMAEFLMEKIHETLTEMGADSIVSGPLPEKFIPTLVYQHSGGGVIMGDDPETSAVNNYMQMWEMENLFVCGASAFPHFGSTNPTLTLGALTYRATEGMIEYLEGDGGMLVQAKTKTAFV